MNLLKKAAISLAATSMIVAPVAASAATSLDSARATSALGGESELEGSTSWIIAIVALAAIIGSPDFPTDKERLRQIATVAYERGIHLEGTARQLHAINCQPRRDRALELPAQCPPTRPISPRAYRYACCRSRT